MRELRQGQRWLSESEPELGLGLVVEVTHRQVALVFPASEVERRYTRQSAPLVRVQFREGDVVRSRDGLSFIVERVEEDEGLFVYHGEGHELPEVSLNDTLAFDSPEERLRVGQWDDPALHDLRQTLLSLKSHWLRSPVRGLLGGRMDLMPHQIDIAYTVSQRQRPRVLLADETGLGKTIEAGLVLHRLLLTGKATRCLLLLPDALVHQWFVELIRRFQLVFQIIDDEYCEALSDPDANPFEEAQCVICSLSWMLEEPQRMVHALEAGWDMLVVDEAHHIEEESTAYDFVSALSRQSWGTLLLTATPEQLGARSHFARLQLLDPKRFDDFARFEEQSQQAEALAELLDCVFVSDGFSLRDKALAERRAKLLEDIGDPTLVASVEDALFGLEEGTGEEQALLQDLLDRYGPGRVMFRNTREQMEGFPERCVSLVPFALTDKQKKACEKAESRGLAASVDPRLAWLAELLQHHPNDKFLVMGSTPRQLSMVADQLKSLFPVEVALFHEELTLLQRDRQAVWFDDPEGPQVMLCSAIGGEGRNFQCASHQVFWSLPHHPEMLEQHIGRLDRIGQGDTIWLHVPYWEGSVQELWARWYHEGLNAFAATFPGGFRALAHFRDDLDELSNGVWMTGGDAIEGLLEETATFRDVFIEAAQQGRNRLLEQSSFQEGRATKLVTSIAQNTKRASVQQAILNMFDAFGVDREPLSESDWSLKPGIGFREDFPWLKGDDMVVTFERERALKRATHVFLTLDHPMVQGALELFLGGADGTCAVALWEDAPQGAVFLECVFVLECVAPASLGVERFFPPTPIRLVVDIRHQDVTESYPPGSFEGAIVPLRPEDAPPSLLAKLAQSQTLIATCKELVEDDLEKLVEERQQAAIEELLPESKRLVRLQEVNPSVTDEDVEWAQEELLAIHDAISSARCRLDSFRFLLSPRL